MQRPRTVLTHPNIPGEITVDWPSDDDPRRVAICSQLGVSHSCKPETAETWLVDARRLGWRDAHEFRVTMTLPNERVSDLLCSAIEGGSNYWAQFSRGSEPSTPKEFLHDLPLSYGTVLLIVDTEDETTKEDPIVLDRAKLVEGLRIMLESYPRHFADWLAENDDAETGDTFLQCCVFGKRVYA